MYFFIVLSACFLAGLIVDVLLRKDIHSLIEETETLDNTRNNFFRQMKLRYENCIKIGREINNTEAFAVKYLDKYRKYGVTLRGYEKASAFLGGLCVVTGVIGALIYRDNAMDLLLLGFLAMYIVAGLRRLINMDAKRRKITVNIVDYFENRFLNAATVDVQEEKMETIQFNNKKEYSDEEKQLIDDILREYLS